MNLTALWFVINIFFVASFIATLFLHRAVMMSSAAEAQGTKQLRKLKLLRNSFIAVTAVLFLAMSGAFISNMYING